MIITREQLAGLEVGDVLSLSSPCGQIFYFVIMERDRAKVILSAPENKIGDVLPVKNIAWEYLIVDDAGDICDSKDKDLTEYFLGGTIMKGALKVVAKEYSTRLMPNMKLVHKGIVQVRVGEDRVEAVKKTLKKIQCVVFNADYGDSTAILFEMFSRAIQGTPPGELPLYLDHLYKAVLKFEKMKEGQLVRVVASEVFFSNEPDAIPLSGEVDEVIRKMREG
ncbi:hypothetical protein AUJ77_00155 [Candidatus Nomurabacteria bacterium CG1_02_43_90]|uniref:Uncharacterized protein n=1 Tax=Candidatus Nomurabacteria bacterium CG1_02_43_90 TaxID=1805281 RepID=A0A1J4VAL2_9BACT|nr:MAG: hypothetical protein AUJ77_00155 [Candidatus Nomurabacteria bacterium CG1_02_43_90]